MCRWGDVRRWRAPENSPDASAVVLSCVSRAAPSAALISRILGSGRATILRTPISGAWCGRAFAPKLGGQVDVAPRPQGRRGLRAAVAGSAARKKAASRIFGRRGSSFNCRRTSGATWLGRPLPAGSSETASAQRLSSFPPWGRKWGAATLCPNFPASVFDSLCLLWSVVNLAAICAALGPANLAALRATDRPPPMMQSLQDEAVATSRTIIVLRAWMLWRYHVGGGRRASYDFKRLYATSADPRGPGEGHESI